ncbi:BMC domain-containing protein, partial [Mycobacterium tuberculosis]|nr:BMC domain-containing protein [Mycobacterium tuberculosis]
MAQASLGLIETIGLVAAVEAADVAVKSASVSLVGYELAEGGLAVVKIQGDVGAVRA